MKILIVEDEIPALENLKECIRTSDTGITVVGTTKGVSDTISWLKNNNVPDLILMDIQLSDGLCFHIFKEYQVPCPVIFTTAYDKYIIDAFQYNCIDYLLKPIDHDKLKNTLRKYKNLQNHFLNNYSSLIDYIESSKKTKSRIVAKKGTEFINLRMEDIVCFFTENKIVFAIDNLQKKYICDAGSLLEMVEILDARTFFRVNRKYIVNAAYITKFKSIDKSKISIEINVPMNEDIIVSQENALAFWKWIGQL